ncbi:hypothetical protein RhiJN_26889 [Ceratobasidium sp. AG-Ba]|nr:hypothetical protein RhiJN_26889 [Ceratobasidium sp. AG-Ba]
MKCGDFVAWVSTEDLPQAEHNLFSQDTQAGGIQRRTRSGFILAEAGKEFKIHWKCTSDDTKFDLHVRVWFHDLKVASGIFTPDTFKTTQTVEGDFEFGTPEITDRDDEADPHDPHVATIRLEFQWVKRCAKYMTPKKRCVECTKSRDASRGQRARPSRYEPYWAQCSVTGGVARGARSGVVHEAAKKAHWPTALVMNYVDIEDDLDQDEGEWHGTFRKRTTLKFIHAPKEFLHEQGWIEEVLPSAIDTPPSPSPDSPSTSNQDEKPDVSLLSPSNEDRNAFENPSSLIEYETIEDGSDDDGLSLASPAQLKSLIKREEWDLTVEEPLRADFRHQCLQRILTQQDQMLRQANTFLQQHEDTGKVLFSQHKMFHRHHDAILRMLGTPGGS